MNELSLSGMFPQTKTEIADLTAQLIESALSGDNSPIKIQVQISALEQVIKAVKADNEFRDAVLNEANKYGSKSFDAFNAKISVKETGVKYDYSFCGLPEYDAVCNEIDKLTEKKKQFEKYLQTISEPIDFVNPETGEMTKIYAPAKTSTTAVTITINK